MAYPLGLDGATQRIREIESRMAALAPEKQTPKADYQVFGSILDEQMQPEGAGSSATYSGLESMVEDVANENGLDPNLAKAVVKAESGFNPKAVSPAGAQGLMQLMPSTAQSLGVQSSLDPEDNVNGGTKYLKSLLQKYHSVPQALAAYNAGPGAVDKHGGIPPYAETQNYVKKVLAYQNQYERGE